MARRRPPEVQVVVKPSRDLELAARSPIESVTEARGRNHRGVTVSPAARYPVTVRRAVRPPPADAAAPA
jgi:hypothetical protein